MDEEHEEIASTLPKDLDALPRLGGFRLRGMEITRLETFIDAVFAFAITMLVIAAQQIRTIPRPCSPGSRMPPSLSAAISPLGVFGGRTGCGAEVTAFEVDSRFSVVVR